MSGIIQKYLSEIEHGYPNQKYRVIWNTLQINKDIMNRLLQLQHAKPRINRWIDCKFRLAPGWSFMLSFQPHGSLIGNPYRQSHQLTRYRLKHQRYATEIHWETNDDLMYDLHRDWWTRCRIDLVDGEEYFYIFPIMLRNRLMKILVESQKLQKMPLELLELIIDFIV